MAIRARSVHHLAPGDVGRSRCRRLLLRTDPMTFVLQRVTPSGSVLTQIRTDALRIGRGTSAELRSENPAVSLEHAVIDEDAAGFTVTDKGSITGTYVNGKPVETARLSKGDVIAIGDLKIEVQIADPGRPLFVRI